MLYQKRKSIPKTISYNRNSESPTVFPKHKNTNPNIIEETIPSTNNITKKREYIKGRFLGKGGFAKCYELICKDNNKIFAAKMLQKSSLKTERQRQKLITEIKIHKSCHHSHVVAFEHNFDDDENFYILLELCQNQTLNELHMRRKVLTEIEVQCYIIQLIKALQYLHSHRIIHRDLKLGNLFLNDKMELKVGDFGLATKLDYDGERKKTICGTPNYIAPEVINTIGHSYEVDIWAIGIIIYTLLVGKPPFETRDVKTTYGKIKKAEYTFPENCKISLPAKNLIKKILVVDPKKRPTLNDILFDDFFNQGIAIPKLMPSSTLAFRPPAEYINKYMPKKNNSEIKLIKETNEENKKNDSNNEITKDSENNNEKKITPIPQFIYSTFLSNKEVYVIKWVDYSNKYGLGYVLNNGLIGVYFNDNTKMLYNPNNKRITVVERKFSDKQELLYTFSTNEFPDDIKNKVFLFTEFKLYLEDDTKIKKSNTIVVDSKEKNLDKNEEKKETMKRRKTKVEKVKVNELKVHSLENTFETNKANNIDNNIIEENDFIFVKKWLKTKHAMIFRFSNKTIQVCFKDKSQIIIHTLNEKITYINKNLEKKVYPLNKALNSSNHEMNKRVKYTKEVLAHMISINKKKSEKSDNNEIKEEITKK